jgi:hypothetical protein
MLLGHAFDACTRLYDRLRSVQNASEGSDKVNLAFLPVVFRQGFSTKPSLRHQESPL